jgi:hypothetical protein
MHETCCICFDEINNENISQCIRLNCNHILHKECLYTYITENFKNDNEFNTCPLCRKHISTNLQHSLNIYNIKNINLNSIVGVSFLIFNLFTLGVVLLKS